MKTRNSSKKIKSSSEIGSVQNVITNKKIIINNNSIINNTETIPLSVDEILSGCEDTYMKIVCCQFAFAKITMKDVGAQTREGLIQYIRFLCIKVILYEINEPKWTSPSYLIDEIWHGHMLRPQHYIAMCNSILGNHIVFYHNPDYHKDSSDEQTRLIRYENTRSQYEQYFQKDGMTKWWPDEPMEECRDILVGFERNGTIQIFVRDLHNKTLEIDCNLNMTILELKEIITKHIGDDMPVDRMNLIFDCKYLDNEKNLYNYRIQKESTLHLTLSLRGC